MSNTTRRLAALLAASPLALGLSLGTAATASAYPTEAPAGTSISQLYAPPAGLVPGTPGSVVWTQPIPAGDPANLELPFQDAPPAHLSYRVIYRSKAIDGTANVQSAAIYVPLGANGTPSRPWDGWRVAAWDHATTGGADLCAPSRATFQIPGPNGTMIDNPELDNHLTTGNEIIGNLLRRNVVVVKVDYEGLGTPGKHPYLIAKSLGRSTIDAVKATRAFLASNHGSASTKWAVAGQSEGGIAALGTSGLAPTLAPELNLRGTLAAVPPVNNKTMVFDLSVGLGFSSVMPLAALMVNGAAMDAPNLAANLYTGNPQTDLLTAEGNQRWADLETKCLQQLGSSDSISISPSRVFTDAASDVYKAELYAKLDENDPRNIPLGPEPIQFWAGGLDLIALQSQIFAAAEYQRDVNGKNVTMRSNPWAIHPNIVDNAYSGDEMADWVADRLGA